MKKNIRGDKLVVTDSIKSYIEEKIDKLTKYFDNDEIEAKIVIKVANNKEIIEVTIPTNKYTLRAEERNDDLYAAIDLVVKRKSIDIKPMDEEEAILQMELLNHDFFMFKNIDENCISVLYKRKDGKFGIINSK